MGKFLKKNWFVVLVATLFIGVVGYYIYDTNKGKLKGKKAMEKMLYMKSMAMIQLLLHSMMNYIHLTELAVLLLYSNRQLLMQTLTQQVK